MPNTASAKKRLRQNTGRRARNRSLKSLLRSQIRKVRDAIKAGVVETSQTELKTTAKRLDQAAAKKVIHPNRAARLKSRLSRAIRAIAQK